MNIQNIRLRRQESTTASAPSLIASSYKSNSLNVTDSNLSSVKTSNESVKLNAQQLHPDNTFLITKSTSSLLSFQQDRLTSALKLKRKNFLLKSASEDSSNFKQTHNEQQQDTNLQSTDLQSNDFNLLQQHQPTRWRRFLQMKKGKSVCESFTDLSTSSLTTSTETETTSNDTNLKAPNQDTKLKHLLYSTQSTQSLTNKIDHKIITKLTNSKSTKSDKNLYNKNTDLQANQTLNANSVVPSSSSYGFKYHKRRRSRRGSYKSQLRNNRNNLSTQFFRTSFDSAVQSQITKRNANLNLQDTTRACSFDNACLASNHNYSNTTISSLGLSYLIEDIHQLSLDDNDR